MSKNLTGDWAPLLPMCSRKTVPTTLLNELGGMCFVMGSGCDCMPDSELRTVYAWYLIGSFAYLYSSIATTTVVHLEYISTKKKRIDHKYAYLHHMSHNSIYSSVRDSNSTELNVVEWKINQNNYNQAKPKNNVLK